MIQVAQNGNRPAGAHAALPVTLDALVADAIACRDAGAAAIHLHPRRPADGVPSLVRAACDPVVAALRSALPGTEISLSTMDQIALGGAPDRIAAIRAWRTPPDVVSLNLVEEGSVELGAALLDRGIGIEAGIADLDDAAALLAAPWAGRITRALVEIDELGSPADAVALARAVDERLAPLGRPRLWHGMGAQTWAVVAAGLAAGHDVRVGLEDTLVDAGGGPAPDNPGQVALVA